MNEDVLNQMDRYFLGQLTDQESQNLLFEISKSQELEATFKIRRKEYEVLEVLAEDNLREKLNQWKVHEKKDNQSKLAWLIPFGIAASILLIFFIYNPFQSSVSQLSEEYYTVDYGFSKSTSTDDPLLFARQILNTKNKKEFKELENSLLKIDTANLLYHRAQYYLGHLYYEETKYDLAIEAFRTSMGVPELTSSSKWYLSLAMLKTGQINEAKVILTEISTSNNDEFKLYASEILQKLEH